MADESPEIGGTKSSDTSDAPAPPTPVEVQPAQTSKDTEPQNASGKANNDVDSSGTDDDGGGEDEDGDEDDEDDEEEEEEDEEPRLKYARLTQHLAPVYRNGDATSSFLVAGDKMVR